MEREETLFDKLKKPFDQKAYKEVKLGRKFTTIDAYYVVERLTEIFGLCGDKWGVVIEDRIVNNSNIACIGYLWYLREDNICKVPAVGDGQIIKGNVAEGYKKAQTNLISKASSFLGIGLDVYKGEHLDDPYQDRAEAQRQKNQIIVNNGNKQKSLKAYSFKKLQNEEAELNAFNFFNETFKGKKLFIDASYAVTEIEPHPNCKKMEIDIKDLPENIKKEINFKE